MAKKETKNKKKTTLEVKLYKTAAISIVLLISAIFLSYFVITASSLKTEINEETANYISFNNSNTTDMMKISNLQKLSNKKGMSKVNENSIDFKITGKKDSKYSIILYPINNKNDLEKIKFYLTKDGKKVAYNTLAEITEIKEDGGIVIYQGIIGKDDLNYNLRMWLSKDYHKNANNISFEIKVK